MARAIFFDAVGTLIHLPLPVGEHYRAVAARFGIDLSADALQTAFRHAWASAPPRPASLGPRADDDKGWWRELVGSVLAQTLTPAQRGALPQDAYFEAVYGHFTEPGVWALFPEVIEVLTALRAAGYRLGVISNFDLRLHHILEGLGVRHFFDGVIVSSQAGAEKPDPQIFRHALRALQVSPEESVHVGDDLERDGGAEALGLRVLHINRPANSLRDLANWLESTPPAVTRRLATPSPEG